MFQKLSSPLDISFEFSEEVDVSKVEVVLVSVQPAPSEEGGVVEVGEELTIIVKVTPVKCTSGEHYCITNEYS